MKKIIVRCAIPVMMLALTSCFKDLGNYDYKDINEVTITGLGTSHNVLFRVDTLRIEPELTMTMDDNDPTRYKYEWRVGGGEYGNVNKRPLIGSDRNLVYPVSLVPGNYTIYYNVNDTKTGVTWTSGTALNVSTAISTGFYIAGENENGNMGVDMVAIRPADTVIIRDLLADNGMPAYKKPVRAFHTGASSNRANAKMWIISEEGAYHVNTTTFETSPMNVFQRYLFTNFELPSDIFPIYVAPRVYAASGSIMASGGSSRVILTNTGDLFMANLFNGDIYGNPVNRVAANPTQRIKLAPFIFYPTTRWDKYIVFDEENRRFLWGTGGGIPGTTLSVLSDAAGGPFPWNQGETNRTLVFGSNSKNTQDGSSYGSSFALMKDDQNAFHIYKFYTVGTSAPAKRGYYPVKDIATDFVQATSYAFSSTRTLLFYAVGSRLYAYDYNPGLEKNYLVYDFGEEITMLESDLQRGNGNNLFVATYSEANKGTIHNILIGTNLNDLDATLDPAVKWSGLVKVKSMDWRSSTH